MLNNSRNFLNRATVTNLHDVNRDSLVDAVDRTIALNNGTTFLDDLNLITVPAAALNSVPISTDGAPLLFALPPSTSSSRQSTSVAEISSQSKLTEVTTSSPRTPTQSMVSLSPNVPGLNATTVANRSPVVVKNRTSEIQWSTFSIYRTAMNPKIIDAIFIDLTIMERGSFFKVIDDRAI
jgi:hypothetical protein